MEQENAEPLRVEREILGQIGNIKIVRPIQAAIPLSEGTHLEVSTDDTIHWSQKNIKDILRMEFFALPVAKVISEGRFTPDLWANIHLNSYPLFDSSVNVFGRNPQSETSWGKPVVIRGNVIEPLPQDEKERLISTFDKYLPSWQKLSTRIKLFDGGIGEIDPQNMVTDEKADLVSKNERLIWLNEKFSLVIIGKPHLSGLHLVVHPRENYWKKRGGFKRPWHIDRSDPESTEHVKGFLEAVSIIVGAERILLDKEGLPFYNPEIHFSGNWASDLNLNDRGGKLNMDYLSNKKLQTSRKVEKRAHRVGANDEWQTSMHGHLYATRDPQTYVRLPSRPQKEVPDQWEGITSLSIDEEVKISALIQQRLGNWLNTNAKDRI